MSRDCCLSEIRPKIAASVAMYSFKMNVNSCVLGRALFGVLLSISVVAHAAAPSGSPAGFDPAKAAERLDALVDAKLREQKIKPNAEIDDATFLRRIYLDVIGRVPTLEEAEAFHKEAGAAPKHREQLIDRLLRSEGYVSHFYNFWADILRINQSLGSGAAEAEAAYQLWLKDALRDNLPYDDLVRQLVSARGQIWENGAVGYYQRDRGMPLDNMSNTVRIFLGTRLECAQCHNHPFDKWTQMDFYRMAAFSYGMTANDYAGGNRNAMQQKVREDRLQAYRQAVGVPNFPVLSRPEDIDRMMTRERERGRLEISLARLGMSEPQFRETAGRGIAAIQAFDQKVSFLREAEGELYRPIRYVSAVERPRDLKLPHDYQYADAKPFAKVGAKSMFGEALEVAQPGAGTIDAYAQWLTSSSNPAFTRVIANRMWKKVFGAGVFEPVDEITEQMFIPNPELMGALEALMKEVGYDLKTYLSVLFRTRAYQRAADANEIVMGAPYYFQGPLLRRMSAEQIWDSIVGLALPQADSFRPRLKGQLAAIDRVRLIYESLSERNEEEYIALVNEISAAIVEMRPKQEAIRQAIVAARNAGNEEELRAKRMELSQVDRKVRDTIAEVAYTRLQQQVKPEQLLAALGMSEKRADEMDVAMSGTDEEEGVVLTSLPRPELPEPPAGLDKNGQKQWRTRMKGELQVYGGLVSGMARASELTSPAPRGHFMREFGQSDREVIENANTAASVPQALNLLNGPVVEALVNPFAVFGRRLSTATSPEETAQLIFQAMLTRPPTAAEIGMVREELQRDPREGTEGVIWALLNTRQFLFIR